MSIELHVGDCRQVLGTLPEASVDAIVTDPPYELGFMGKGWDKSGVAFDPETWSAALRVLKPGGHLVAFGGTRTYHRMVCAIEDAGFEVRDQLAWVYGSGFPKSLDVSKAIDKMGPPGQAPFAEFAAHYEERRKEAGLTHAQVCEAGKWYGTVNHGGSSVNWANGYGMPTVEQWVILQPLLELDDRWKERVERVQYEREVLGLKPGTKLAVAPGQENDRGETDITITAPGSEAARQWEGWGTALKPAWEPIVLARKPLVGTVAANVLAHGTGALNIDGCRIGWPDGVAPEIGTPGWGGPAKKSTAVPGQDGETVDRLPPSPLGRWPANILHDGSDEVVSLFPTEAGASAPVRGNEASAASVGVITGERARVPGAFHGDTGSAARFFYCAKASREDRNEGLAAFKPTTTTDGRQTSIDNLYLRGETERANHHPTVKPTDLMRWLCRLITPPGGVVLDPFMGSGSTGKAAVLEGFRFTGIELSPEYLEIARARIDFARRQGHQPSLLEAA